MRRALFSMIALIGGIVTNARAADATAEKTTVSAKAYVSLTNIDQKSNDVSTDASGTGLDVKRFYVGIDHAFGDIWSANVTSDFNYVSNDAETQIYIKKAYLQAAFSSALTARAGSADLPWVPFVEGLYGYRYVENVLIDHLKFGTSADWGVHALGKSPGGTVSYAAALVNGGGYKNPTRTKSMDFEARISATPVAGLTVAVGVYSGKLGQDRESVTAQHTAERLDALVAYATPSFRVGAEYFDAKDWRQVLSSSADKADGYSAWASVNFSVKVAAFARYDSAKPSKDLAPDLQNEYFNVGVAYKPRGNVDVAFAYKQDKTTGGTLSTSNGTIGGTRDGRFDQFGVWTQVAF